MLDRDRAIDFIQIRQPELAHCLTPEEYELYKKAVIEIKLAEMVALVKDIIPLIELFGDEDKDEQVNLEKMKTMLDIILLNEAVADYSAIFKILPEKLSLKLQFELERLKITDKNRAIFKVLYESIFQFNTDDIENNIKSVLIDQKLDAKISKPLYDFILKVRPDALDQQLISLVTKFESARNQPTMYRSAYSLRHQYFLNKPDRVRDRPEAFHESISERFLVAGHSHISKYLRGEGSELTDEHKAVLSKVYPAEKLNQKSFRREAHQDIALSLYEIQTLIQGIIKKVLEVDKGKMTEGYAPTALSENQDKAFFSYTKMDICALIIENNLEEFKKLINDSEKANRVDYYTGMSFLAYAIKFQKIDFVKYLIECKADINLADNVGYTPLHHACETENKEIFDLLLSASCKVNVEDRGFYSPLYIAAEKGNADFVKKLLEKEANPNDQRNQHRNTVLHIAARNSHEEVVKVLLDSKKVDTRLRNKEGTAADVAKSRNQTIYKLINDYKNPFQNNSTNNNILTKTAIKNTQLNTVTAAGLAVLKAKHQQLKGTIGPVPLSTPSPLNLFTGGILATGGGSLSPAMLPPPHLLLPSQIYDPNVLTNLLLNPKENKARLEDIYKKSVENNVNPFLIYAAPSITLTSEPITRSFLNVLSAEVQMPTLAKDKFNYYVDALRKMQDEKITFAQGYFRIVRLIESIRKDGLPVFPFVYEIFKAGYLEHLILIQEGKTPLQVAIDVDSIESIKEILLAEPDRSGFSISYKQKMMNELEYAIYLGKVTTVESLMELAQKNTAITFGKTLGKNFSRTSDVDYIKEAKKQKQKIESSPAAFKEADEHFDINPMEASKKNIARLFKDLAARRPCQLSESIHGLFTPDEYKVFRVLVGEKAIREKSPKQKELESWRRQARGIIAIASLEKEKEKLEAYIKENPDDNSAMEDYQKVCKGLSYAQQASPEQRYKMFLEKYGYDSSEPMSKNIFKHATNNFAEIEKNNKLTTVHNALKDGLIRFSSTPEGTKHNIFFSQNSEKAYITPFRSRAEHVIKLNINTAIQEGMLSEEDIYTTPHIPAFKFERVEAPISFIGDNPKIQTIFRVYHYLDDEGKKKKMYWYDYYNDKNKVGSWHETYGMEEEFFVGDNIDITAYRFMRHLRALKGPFTEGSYYHYILKNCQNIEIIDSAKAQLFSVLLTEGKIIKDVLIPHKAVTVEKNAKPSTEVTPDLIKKLGGLTSANNVTGFRETIHGLGVDKMGLRVLLLAMVQRQKGAFVNALLNYGVPIHYDNNKILHAAYRKLEEAYVQSGNNTNSDSIKIAVSIVAALLYVGSVDENDPKHIRHLASPDSCALKSVNSQIWDKTTEQDLNELKYLLFIFNEQLGISQKLLLDHVVKHLPALYHFTFNYGFLEHHKYIVQRINAENKPLLIMQENNKKLLNYVAENNVDAIVGVFNNALKVEYNNLYFVISNAIRLGKVDVVAACFPFLKDTESAIAIPPLHLAIKYKQIEIVKKLIELGGVPSKPNFIEKDSLSLAFYFGFFEAVECLVGTATNQEECIAAILTNEQLNNQQKQQDKLVEKLAEHLDIKTLCFIHMQESTVKESVKPLLIAIEKGKPEHVIVLLKNYEKKLIEKNRLENYKVILKVCLLEAARLNKSPLYKHVLCKLICGDLKISNTLFNTKDHYLLGEIIKHASVEMLQQALSPTVITNARQKIFDLENAGGFNYLQIAVTTGEVEKIKIIKNEMPNLSYQTEKSNIFDLIVLSINKSDNVSGLDYLSKEEKPFVEFFKDKPSKIIKLLAAAVAFGRIAFTRWFFESGLIDKNYLGKQKENILQLILKNLSKEYIKKHHKDIKDAEAIKATLKYLCEDLGLDINHQNSLGKTILFYPPAVAAPVSFYLPEVTFYEFVSNHPNTNFLIQDNDGNTVLHNDCDKPDYKNYEKRIDRFIEQGGDLNVMNIAGKTAYETALIYSLNSSVKAIITNKFRDANAYARPILPEEHFHAGIITCSSNNQLYILVQDNNKFVLRNSIVTSEYASIVKSPNPINENNFILCRDEKTLLFAHHEGRASRLPVASKLVTNSRWVALPTNFKAEEDATYLACNDKEEFKVNQLTMCMLKGVLVNNDFLRQKSAKDTAKSKYKTKRERENAKKEWKIENELVSEIKNAANHSCAKLASVYEPILFKQNITLAPKEMVDIVNDIGLPYSAKTLNPEKGCYESILFYSPLAALVYIGETNLSEFLNSDIPVPTGEPRKNSPLAIAIRKENFEAFNQLLNSDKAGIKKIDLKSIFKYKSSQYKFVLSWLEDLVKTEKVKPAYRKSLSTFVTDFSASVKANEKEHADLEEFMQKAQELIMKIALIKNDTKKTKSQKRSKKAEVDAVPDDFVTKNKKSKLVSSEEKTVSTYEVKGTMFQQQSGDKEAKESEFSSKRKEEAVNKNDEPEEIPLHKKSKTTGSKGDTVSTYDLRGSLFKRKPEDKELKEGRLKIQKTSEKKDNVQSNSNINNNSK